MAIVTWGLSPLANSVHIFPIAQLGVSHNWRQDGTWLYIHDSLREWIRIEQERHPSPSEAIIDSQSVKSAAMVSQELGFDAGKKITGRKRFMTVDTLGLVLRVLVTAANVGEPEGGKRVLKRVNQSQRQARLTTIWVDGGFDGEPYDSYVVTLRFMQWVMDFCRWIDCTGGSSTRTNQGLCFTQKTLAC